MTTVLLILLAVILVILVLTASMKPLHSTMSRFELERRSTQGDAGATQILRREQLLVDVVSVQRIVVALFLVLFVLLSVVVFDWLIGVLVAVIVALEYGALARIGMVHRVAQNLYQRAEPKLLRFVDKFGPMFVVLRGRDDTPEISGQVNSREELQHLIDNARDILTADEKRLLTHSLSFSDKLVRDVMTPRSVIDSVDKTELLGPLALDELHKTGHSRVPVIDGDIDHIIGILYVQDLLTIDKKRSLTAEKAMDGRVFYIREDQTLHHALSAFIRTHHHLFVVVNEYRETVGVITLEDVVETLLGRKIIDEFDAHDDLRAVAARNVRGNNTPKQHEDV